MVELITPSNPTFTGLCLFSVPSLKAQDKLSRGGPQLAYQGAKRWKTSPVLSAQHAQCSQVCLICSMQVKIPLEGVGAQAQTSVHGCVVPYMSYRGDKVLCSARLCSSQGQSRAFCDLFLEELK